jgi:hypothetical protein
VLAEQPPPDGLERRFEMRRNWFHLAVLIAVLTAPVVVFGVTAKEAPETITLDDCVAKRSAVEFPHAAHAELGACTACHHTQEGLTAGSDTVVQPCSECHTAPEKAETPKCSELSLKKNHFHINCIDCHKERAADFPDKVLPVKCEGCHPKEGG